MNKIHKYAWAGLIFSLLGYFPKVGHLFSLLGFIAGILMYRELETAGIIKKAAKLYVAITLLSLVAVLFATLGWVYGHLPAVVLSTIAYVIGLVVARLTYLLYKEVAKTSDSYGGRLFKVSAVMLQVAAFTMPILIGFLIQGIAQLVIFVAVIKYKPQDQV